MRLADLDPKLEGDLANGVLRFDCPFPGHTHKLRIRVSHAPPHMDGEAHVWQASGTFPDTLTITPSINACRPDFFDCWHGIIHAGEVR